MILFIRSRPRNGIWGPSTSFVSWGCSFHREICRCSARACDDVCLIGDEQTVARTCRACMWRTSSSLDLRDFSHRIIWRSHWSSHWVSNAAWIEEAMSIRATAESLRGPRWWWAETQYPCSFNHGVLDCLLCSGSTWWAWWQYHVTTLCLIKFTFMLYVLFQAFFFESDSLA